MVTMTMSIPPNEGTEAPAGPTIPNYRDDERARARYASMIESRKKAFATEHEGSIRRNAWAKRDELREELDKAGAEWERRKDAAETAKEAYRKAYPQHVKKTRFVEPTGMENLKSLGAAGKLYNTAKEAWLAAAASESDIRRIEHNENQLDIELKKALERAPAVIKEVTESEKWLAEIHADEDLAAARARVEAIDAERAAYAKRLGAGEVPDEELRLRSFGENDIKPFEMPIDGVVFVRAETYGPKTYLIARDVRKQHYALPYDPRLEPLFTKIIDVTRSGGKDLAVRAHVRLNSRDPFSMLDHFLVCNDGDEEKAKEALAQQQTWAKARRTIAAATECDEGETNAIALLAEFATKAPA
jgi:hypothetical protein